MSWPDPVTFIVAACTCAAVAAILVKLRSMITIEAGLTFDVHEDDVAQRGIAHVRGITKAKALSPPLRPAGIEPESEVAFVVVAARGEFERWDLHEWQLGSEAEELRRRFEKIAAEYDGSLAARDVQVALDEVDARDSLLFLHLAGIGDEPPSKLGEEERE